MSNNTQLLLDGFHTVYIVCLTLAVLFLVITIVLFFLFGIRNVIVELSGKERRQAIEQMASGQPVVKSRIGIGNSGRIGTGSSGKIRSGPTTSGRLGKNKQRDTDLLLTSRIPKVQQAAQPQPAAQPAPRAQRAPAGTMPLSNEFTVTRDIVVVHTQETI